MEPDFSAPLTSAMDIIPWMLDMHIELSKAVEVKPSKYGGTGVFATRPISEGDVLLQIPKSAVLSSKTCGIANLFLDHDEIELLNLPVVAYLFEKTQGKESPWCPFIEFVEKAPLPDVPRLWSQQEQELLKGTNLTIWDGLDADQLQENYKKCEPLLLDYAKLVGVPVPSYEDFVRATLLVSSRAFDVDNYHELAIAPGACFFNHSDHESVHFETDGMVCVLCGSLSCDCIVESDDGWEEDEQHEDGSDDNDSEDGESEHEEDSIKEDLSDEDNESNESDYDEEDENACVIRAIKDIKDGEEIFNTYGEDPNGVLLARYGFTIWKNAHEVIDLEPQVEKFAKKFKVTKTVNSWKDKQEEKLEEHEEEPEEDPLFLGIVNCAEGPRPSSGLVSLARKLKIDKKLLVRELATLRLKSYAFNESSVELYSLAMAEQNTRIKNILILVGTEKWLLETALKPN